MESFPAGIRAASLGISVVAGWCVYDLAMLATSGNFYLFPSLVPGYAAALITGAGIGAACSLNRGVVYFTIAALAGVIIGLRLLEPDVAGYMLHLPRALLLLNLAFLAAAAISRSGRPAAAPALGLGLVAATAFEVAYARHVTALVALASTAGLLFVATGTRRHPRRRAVVGATFLMASVLLAVTAVYNGVLPRPDRSSSSVVPGATAPNLLLIVLDTVSAQHLAPYGYHRVTTPGIDAFARSYAVQFTGARSVSSWTLPSHASIFTGLYPSQHGADHPRTESEGTASDALGPYPVTPLRSTSPTLAEVLSSRGYQTAGIVANSGYLNHAFGLDRGFDHYDDRAGSPIESLLLLQLAGAKHYVRKGTRPASTITDLAIAWIDARNRQQPFFMFLNYMEAHAPYVPPSPYAYEFEPTQPTDPLAYGREHYVLQYDRELRYLDAHVTRLIEALQTRALFDNTVIVITSDHGEAFGSHGIWRHDVGLYEELIKVPLYVKSVGVTRPGVSSTPVTGPDLYRLMLEQVGISPGEVTGSTSVTAELYAPVLSHSPREKRDFVSRNDRNWLVWMDTGLKWVVSSRGDVEAYDLSTDPFERSPIPLSTDQVVTARARADAWWEAHPPIPRTEPSATALDPTVIDRLRALGYVR